MKNKKLKKSVKLVLTAVFAGVIATATTITLLAINSSGVKVVNFVGESKAVVEKWVLEYNIPSSQVTYTEEYSDTYEEGIVMAQSLKEGETLSNDSSLTITVSEGADPTTEFTLPDFTGKKEDEIKSWFEDNKFSNYIINKEYNPEIEVGIFISCDHEANTTVRRGDNITVKVSGEQEEVVVIDLSSYSKSNIEAWAEANSITIEYIEEFSDDIESGKIISISVNPGDVIHTGDTIQIAISKGKESEQSTEETTKSSTDNRDYASSTTRNSSVSSNSSGSSSQGQKQETIDTSVPTESGTCYAQDTSLYDGKSASEIYSAFSAGGCKVHISYARDASSNPYSYNGGIKSASIDGSNYYVTVYQSWAN